MSPSLAPQLRTQPSGSGEALCLPGLCFWRGPCAHHSFWACVSEWLPWILVSASLAEKDSPRARLCLSSPAPTMTTNSRLGKVPHAGSKGQKIGLEKGKGAPKKLGKDVGYQIVTHQPQLEPRPAALFGWACFQEPNKHDHPWKMGAEGQRSL